MKLVFHTGYQSGRQLLTTNNYVVDTQCVDMKHTLVFILFTSITERKVVNKTESEVVIMFGICLLIFIGLCIYHACEKELPADYHNNWRLEAHDSQLVREGKMTQRQFEKNMNNGKYRQESDKNGNIDWNFNYYWHYLYIM